MKDDNSKDIKKAGISRRDFLQGSAVTAITASIPFNGAFAQQMPTGPDAHAKSYFERVGIDQHDPSYYPPALKGMRGSHPGSFQVGHQLRDDGGWKGDSGKDTGEVYDLVVVGAGISGLAAAYEFRKKNPHAKILILDNHDDFGGHAKRNEFETDKGTLIGYGGAQSMDTGYPPEAISVLAEIGINMRYFRKYYDVNHDERRGLKPGVYFNKDSFGRDATIGGLTAFPEAKIWDNAPIADQAKKDLHRIFSEKVDYLPSLTRDQKLEYLSGISFKQFLSKDVKAHPDVIKYFQSFPSELTGLGSDATSAIACIWSAHLYPTYPKFLEPLTNLSDGMNLGIVPHCAYGYICHFPDGNAGIARSFVRSLIPESLPGNNMEDLVTAKVDYGLLDSDQSNIRLRLNSPVVKVKHLGAPSEAKDVEITYVLNENAYRVKASNVVLACYNMIIPKLCPEMPAAQKEALAYPVKVPLVYTNVQIRNSKALQKLGLNQIYCPNSLFYSICLDFPVSMGDYKAPDSEDDPCILHLSCHIPTDLTMPPRAQRRMARMFLYTTPFEKFEQILRDQLDRALGPGGFDSSRDIQAITINRWPHGYADSLNGLDDKAWGPGQKPTEIGSKPFGRITIANTDSGMGGSGGAIWEAIRAVKELS